MKKNNQANNSSAAKQKPAGVQQEPVVAAVPADNKSGFLSFLSFEEKISLALLLGVILLVVLIRSNFLMIPFERDEGAYSYYGKLLLQGKIPYKDFYEQKFPGIFYFYAFFVGVFGDTVRGMHTGFIWLNVATILLIYFTVRNLFTPIAGLISATTFAIVSITPFLSGFTVQAEHGVAFFSSLGLLFYSLYNKSQKWYHCFFMGISFGCAFMVKTNGIFFVLWGGLILVADFFFDKRRSVKEFFSRIGIYSAGVFLFIIILFAIILAKGSWQEMIYWTYDKSKSYVGQVTIDQGIQFFNNSKNAILMNYEFFWIHGLLAIVLCLIKPISYKTKFFGLSLIFFSFIMITPGMFFYGHYWIQTLPGLSVAGGLTYYCIVTGLEKGFKLQFKGIKYIYLAIFAFFVYSNLNGANKSYYFEPDYEAILRAVYGDNPFPETMEIADFITANAKPGDGLAAIGSEPEIYFYTKINCPSRHCFFASLVEHLPKEKEWQAEFISDVEKAKPRFFVFYNVGISLLVRPNSDHYIFDWMSKYIDGNYRLIGVADMIPGQRTVYKWKNDALTYKPVSKENVYVFERR